jgi:hypothetical protein
MKTLDIQALTWFDKVNGNSYFSALITLDYGTENEKTIKLPFQYGYGEQYEQETKAVLTEHNYISANYGQSLYSYCKDNGIILRSSNRKNCLKRELKNL